MEFFDVGAVVWILRKCVWWVPDFTVEKYADTLTELDRQMRRGEPVIAHSTPHLIRAQRWSQQPMDLLVGNLTSVTASDLGADADLVALRVGQYDEPWLSLV